MTRKDIVEWIEDEMMTIKNDDSLAWMKDAAILAQIFFCAAYHEHLHKTTFYWALAKLFKRDENTGHDLHYIANSVLSELKAGMEKPDAKTDEKPEKETHCYYVTIKQFRQSEGFVLADRIETARFIANQAAQKGIVTWTLPETRSTAKRVNPDKSFQTSAAFFNALEIPSSYIALKSLYDQMRGENE